MKKLSIIALLLITVLVTQLKATGYWHYAIQTPFSQAPNEVDAWNQTYYTWLQIRNYPPYSSNDYFCYAFFNMNGSPYTYPELVGMYLYDYDGNELWIGIIAGDCF